MGTVSGECIFGSSMSCSIFFLNNAYYLIKTQAFLSGSLKFVPSVSFPDFAPQALKVFGEQVPLHSLPQVLSPFLFS